MTKKPSNKRLKNYSFTLLTLMIISGCSVLESPQETRIGSVIYLIQDSKREVQSEDYPSSSLISIQTAILRKSPSLQIIYSTKKERKKYKGEYYNYFEYTVDTIRKGNFDSSFKETEYQLLGIFLPPKGQIPFLNSKDLGVSFLMYGSCIRTWVSFCNDSNCSTTHQNKGEYRYIGDSIEVTYFQNRNYPHNLIPLEQNPIKSINDVNWKVISPSVKYYTLNQVKDTLIELPESGIQPISSTGIIKDTLIIQPTKQI